MSSRTSETQRDFEDIARKCIAEMRVVLNELSETCITSEKRGSMERSNQSIMELRRDNQGIVFIL